MIPYPFFDSVVTPSHKGGSLLTAFFLLQLFYAVTSYLKFLSHGKKGLLIAFYISVSSCVFIRACAEAWAVGGLEAEKAERGKWETRERRKIQESIDALSAIKQKAEERKRQKHVEERDASAKGGNGDAAAGLWLLFWKRLCLLPFECLKEINSSSVSSSWLMQFLEYIYESAFLTLNTLLVWCILD